MVITALGTAPVDLSGITASSSTTITSGDLTLDLDTDLGTVSVEVAGGSGLTLTATQADGLTVGGAGAVTVVALGSGTDLSAIDPAATLTAQVISTLDIRGNAALGTVDVYRVTGDLTLSAAQADGIGIEGAGEITITGLANATDLSNVAASGTVAATVTAGIDVSGNTTLGNVDSYTVEAAGTLTLSAAQASGKPITGAGNVAVVALGSDPVDLSMVSVGGSQTATVQQGTTLAATTNLAGFDLVVAAGQTLTLTADQANGLSISGDGTVVVTDPGGTAFDLSGITVSGDKTLSLADSLTLATGTDLGAFSVTVAAGETLTLSPTQAGGRAVTGAGNVAVTNLTADTDLANIAATGTVVAEVSSTVDVTGNANLGTVDAFEVTGALTLSAAQANGLVVEGTGTVAVANLGAAPVDLTGIAATATAAIPSGNVTLAATTDLGSVAITVASGATLSLLASQADGAAISGAGDVTVTALAGDGDTDLSGVDPSGTLTVLVNGTVDASGNSNLSTLDVIQVTGALTLSADQADGLAVTGTGDVTVVDLVQTAVDLAGISVGGDKVIDVTSSLLVDTGTNLGAFRVAVAADQTITLTADQANGRTVAGGGNLTVTPMGQATDLSNVTASGTVTAQFAASTDVTGNTSLDVVDAYHVLSNQTLTLSGSQATARNITGPGAVTVRAIASDTDLSGAGALGTITATVESTVDISANDTLDAVDILQVNAGGKLTLTADQADGRTITGAGDVTATSFGATAVDLSTVTATGTLTVTLAGNVTVPEGTDFGNFGLLIGAAQIMRITAEQADGLTMKGTGIVIVTGDPAGFDFSGISGTLTVFFPDADNILTIKAGETVELTVVEASSYNAIEGDGTLGLYEDGVVLFDSLNIAETLTLAVPADRTLILSAEQADGLSLGGDGTLAVVGEGADESTVETTDISSVQADTVFESLGALTRIVTGDSQNVEFDAADIDPLSEAGGTLTIAGGADVDVVNAQLQTFTDGTPPSVLNLLALEFEGLSAEKSLVPDRLTVDGSHPDAIKAFWIPLDQAYVGSGDYYNQDINTSFAFLGNDYVRYLNDGGAPLLDIVKVPEGRAQSLHDNLLGNLRDASIADRFPGEGNDPRTEPAQEFGDRPEHPGAIADGVYSDVNALSGVMGWDIAHGYDYPASMPSFYAVIDADNTITGDENDNYLYGGAGDDSLDGGDGEDTAPYVSDRSDFALAYDSVAKAWTIDDTVAAGQDEGTDTLNGIEEILFGNGSTMAFNAELANGFHPGTGNGSTGFVIDTNPDHSVEVGLKAKEAYTGNDLSPDMGTYHASAGFGHQSGTPGDLSADRATWNVEYSVDLTGSGKTIGDFEVLLTLDPDPAAGTPDQPFVLDFNDIPGLADEEQQAVSDMTVLQDSQNLGFDFWDTWFSDFNFDPRLPGEYRFELTVNDPASGTLVGETAIVVDVRPGLLVDAARDPANDGELNEDGVPQYATIQAAIDAAATGDTIQVLAGSTTSAAPS